MPLTRVEALVLGLPLPFYNPIIVKSKHPIAQTEKSSDGLGISAIQPALPALSSPSRPSAQEPAGQAGVTLALPASQTTVKEGRGVAYAGVASAEREKKNQSQKADPRRLKEKEALAAPLYRHGPGAAPLAAAAPFGSATVAQPQAGRALGKAVTPLVSTGDMARVSPASQRRLKRKLRKTKMKVNNWNRKIKLSADLLHKTSFNYVNWLQLRRKLFLDEDFIAKSKQAGVRLPDLASVLQSKNLKKIKRLAEPNP